MDPYCNRDDDFLHEMVRKSRIHVKRDGQPSCCPMIIEGIVPQQQIDLCTSDCTNLALFNTVDSRSTPPDNPGPVPAIGEFFIS